MRFRNNIKVWADKSAKWKTYAKSLEVSRGSESKVKNKTKKNKSKVSNKEKR